MKVLVLGSGGREHAIVRALLRDPHVEHVIAAPGNAGIAQDIPTFGVTLTDPTEVVAAAREHHPDLVVIGPEAPLAAGVSDALREAGFTVFGPSAAAAMLEGSKAFAKEIMAEAQVPTAMARVADNAAEAAEALDSFGAPYVVKDDGLAAGKGVVVTESRDEALAHAQQCFDAGGKVVIEEYLDGPEVSLFVISDGERVVPLAPAQDFKRIYDGDQGPNTGGMGAYSPLAWAPENLVDEIVTRVAEPTIAVMAQRGTPFAGVLYCGIALTSRGLRVVEFNARFGDPETQAVLARLQTPLGQLLLSAARGALEVRQPLRWDHRSAVAVVLAAKNYPAEPILGARVKGTGRALEQADVTVEHAGTSTDDRGKIVSSGGRVLSVVAMGKELAQARERAYAALAEIELEGGQYRSDIALKAELGQIQVPSASAKNSSRASATEGRL